jgi:glycosyltransferase involved in cell wall biosynthesis
LVVLQAAQMCRPVVATNLGGLLETVSDQETGLLFENENVAALTEAIAYLLKHPAIAVEMGVKARSRALETFSVEAHVAAYDALYTKLIENGGLRTA